MHGFKEDFQAWRKELTPEETAMLAEQTQNEYDKKYRKTDVYKKDLPKDKSDSFAKIMGKFFDNEAADYRKEVISKNVDPNALLEKAGAKPMEDYLSMRIFEHDRDADRRYFFAMMEVRKAMAKGEVYPECSPMEELWAFQNNDTESHEGCQSIIEFLKIASERDDCPAAVKPLMQAWVKQGVPPMGENFEVYVPTRLARQTQLFEAIAYKMLFNHIDETGDEEKALKEVQEFMPELSAKVLKWMIERYVTARDGIEKRATAMKDWYKEAAKRTDPKLTKADLLKEIWAELPKVTDQPIAPLDDEALAEYAQIPAYEPCDYPNPGDAHSWGIADKLYKSEAVDMYGGTYLVGVYTNEKEAEEGFMEWAKMYEESKEQLKVEMEQWGKAEQARLDKKPAGRERIQKAAEEARSR